MEIGKIEERSGMDIERGKFVVIFVVIVNVVGEVRNNWVR